MEVETNAQFVYVYLVRKMYDFNTSYLYTSSIRRPENIIEVYLTENEAVLRAETLAHENNDYPYLSKVTTSKQLGLTIDNGKTVSILDMLNTFKVSHGGQEKQSLEH